MSESELPTVEVAAAVLQADTPPKTFAVRKAHGENTGYWEFPGGKREAGESLPECLRRELAEELAIDALIGRYIGSSEFTTSSAVIQLHAYLVTEWSADIVLKEHDACVWLPHDQLLQLNWSPADIPLVKQLSLQMPGFVSR